MNLLVFDEDALLANGWREIDDRTTSATHTFSKRVYGYPVCQTNGKLWINLHYWDYRVHGVDHDAFDLEIRAQTIDGAWVILKVYAISDQSKIPGLCELLLKSWVAANS